MTELIAEPLPNSILAAADFGKCVGLTAIKHGCEHQTLGEMADWIEARLTLLDEHEAILAEAKLEVHPDFSSPAQAERSAFAAKLRQGQALSASQAMVLMAAKLEAAEEHIRSLQGALAGYRAGGHPVEIEAVMAVTNGESAG